VADPIRYPGPCGWTLSTRRAWRPMALGRRFVARSTRVTTCGGRVASPPMILTGVPPCGSLKGGRWESKWQRASDRLSS